MAHYLVYWKTFWDHGFDTWNLKSDKKWNPHKDAKDHVQTLGYGSDARSFKAVVEGDTLWVVGTSEPRDKWLLLQKLHVVECKEQSHGYKRARSDRSDSLFFDPWKQDNCETILKKLSFASGQSIPKTGRKIGLHIQSPRQLSEADKNILSTYASRLE